jgi:D-alanyl-D-alanine carboxypeptidase
MHIYLMPPSGPSYRKDITADPINELVRTWQVANGAPDVSVAIMRSGVLLHTVAPDTVHQTASLGKHFTAALALLLAESGEGPALDAPLSPYLPEVLIPVTLRQLLSHTAGISTDYFALDLARDYSDSEILEVVTASPLEFAPGQAWSYSNEGYLLAGIAIGRATGRFYGDLLRERIFAPLGMSTATVNTPDAPIGFVRETWGLARADYISHSLNRLADGAISISVEDFLRWDAALWNHWAPCLDQMFVETRLNSGAPTGYGLGWFLGDAQQGRIAEHDGVWQGFSTAMVRYLDHGVSAVVLSNLEDADAPGLAHDLARAVL